MTEQEIRDDERAGIVKMIQKKIEACEYYRDQKSDPLFRREWQRDIDLYNSVAELIQNYERPQ